MATLSVTIAVTTGTQYITGSTGSIYTFDGSQPASFTFPWVENGTVRLDQSGSSNDGHPLIFSTSNSAVLATMKAGIISSGVTYYLDGSSNQSDYTNTTTFNAATTRYIEIAPSSQTDFYFACWVHGIGMGGIIDITQTTWGALGWDDGNWGKQNECTVVLTGQEITTSPGTLEAYNQTGWGRQFWGDNDWGIAVDQTDVAVTGIEITTSPGTVDAYNSEGWGRYFWGEEDWGNTGVSVIASVTGEVVTSSIGTPVVEDDIEVGWGRKTWGNLAWGDAYAVLPAGQQITSAIGTAIGSGGVIVTLTGQEVTAGFGSVDITADGTTVVVSDPEVTVSVGTPVIAHIEVFTVTGQEITSGVGTIAFQGATEVDLTGQEITSSLGSFTVSADVTIVLTGQAITSALGTAVATPGQEVKVTGQAITSALGTVTTVQTAVIKVTGQQITLSVGSAHGLAWAPVDTGSTVSYTPVNTGSSVTWTDVDLAA